MKNPVLGIEGYLVLLVCGSLIQLAPTRVDAAIASVGFNGSLTVHQSKKGIIRQQTSFSAEDPIQHPVNVPPDILQLLRQDVRNQTCLREGQSKEDIPASWFVASAIELNNDRLSDLIVMAGNPCLNGANVVPFWIFRKTSGRYALLLSKTAFALEVLATRSKAYRNLRLTSLTAKTEQSTIYKFDGLKYREWHHIQKAIRQ